MLLGQYIEYCINLLVITGFRTTSTNHHPWQLAKVKAALDERIPGVFLIPPLLNGILRSSTRARPSDKLIDVRPVRFSSKTMDLRQLKEGACQESMQDTCTRAFLRERGDRVNLVRKASIPVVVFLILAHRF
jgi:hypothetical protein